MHTAQHSASETSCKSRTKEKMGFNRISKALSWCALVHHSSFIKWFYYLHFPSLRCSIYPQNDSCSLADWFSVSHHDNLVPTLLSTKPHQQPSVGTHSHTHTDTLSQTTESSSQIDERSIPVTFDRPKFGNFHKVEKKKWNIKNNVPCPSFWWI